MLTAGLSIRLRLFRVASQTVKAAAPSIPHADHDLPHRLNMPCPTLAKTPAAAHPRGCS